MGVLPLLFPFRCHRTDSIYSYLIAARVSDLSSAALAARLLGASLHIRGLATAVTAILPKNDASSKSQSFGECIEVNKVTFVRWQEIFAHNGNDASARVPVEMSMLKKVVVDSSRGCSGEQRSTGSR